MMARATTNNFEPGKKRKREDEISHTWKKRRAATAASPGEVDFQDQALQLEEKIIESRSNYNSICTLLEYLQQDGVVEDEKTVAAVALCRVFCRLMVGGKMSKLRGSSDNEATIMQWLRERLQDYEQGLLRMLKNEDITTQSTALTIVMRLVKEIASNLKEDGVWQNGLFGQLLQTLIEEEVAEHTRIEFVDKYVEQYDDVRYRTFASLAYVLNPT